MINKKRGRKKRHPSEILRTKVWVEYVKKNANRSAFLVEVFLREKPLKAGEKLYQWNRYENGLHSPNSDYVEEVNKKFPGSREVYNHIIWEILTKESLSLTDIELFINRFDSNVRFLLISALDQYGFKRRPFNEELVNLLINKGNLDSLAIALLTLHESMLLCSPKLRELALELYYGLTLKLAADPLYFVVHPELFDLMDQTFKHHIFLAPNIRLNTVIFWQTIRDSTWPKDLKEASKTLEEKSRKRLEMSPKTRIESLDGSSYFDL